MANQSISASIVASHFKDLKATGDEKWWDKCITFEWNRIRPGKNSTKWLSINYTPKTSNKPQRFSVSIRGELHSGQIMPNLPEDVVELKAKYPDSKIELRTMKPSLQFQKWSKQVPTQEDRISLIIGEDGKPVVPGDEYLSSYDQVASYIDEIFKYEMKQRTERGTFLMVYLSQHKSASAKEVKDAIGHVHECDTIIRDDDANTIRDRYPDKYADILKGVLTVSSTKVGTILQERISDKAPKNKGAKLPNPMTRITIPFDPKTGQQHSITILDKEKPITLDNGKKMFEPATYNGQPINANNIHAFIPSRSIIDGVINIDSVCFSQLGISLPIKASCIVVQQPTKRENNVFNMCNEIYGDDYDDESNFTTLENITSVGSTTNVESSKKVISDSLLQDLAV